MPWRRCARRDAGTVEVGVWATDIADKNRMAIHLRIGTNFPPKKGAGLARRDGRGGCPHMCDSDARSGGARQLKIGSARIRFFVAAKIALQSAGAIGGTDGSPIPVGTSTLGTAYTSTAGVSSIRSGA